MWTGRKKYHDDNLTYILDNNGNAAALKETAKTRLNVAELNKSNAQQKEIDATDNAQRSTPPGAVVKLALLWQNHVERRSTGLRQCGHLEGGERARAATAAFRTAGRVG